MTNRAIKTVLLFSLALSIYISGAGPSHAMLSRDLPSQTKFEDHFDPRLCETLRSVSDLTDYFDNNYKEDKSTVDFVRYMAAVISLRFYHGYSYYSEKDNWIAATLGDIFWQDLAAIVLPDDILKHPNAACSQQSMILMACAKKYGFDFRKAAFDHHFAVEIFVDGKWQFIDTNMEVFPPQNSSLEELVASGGLDSLYADRLQNNFREYALSNPNSGPVNKTGANRVAQFHAITYFLSEYFFCFIFLAQCLYFFWQSRHFSRNSLTRH